MAAVEEKLTARDAIDMVTNGTSGDTLASIEYDVFRGSKEGKVVKAKNHRKIGPDDVLVEITHSGLCATDTHLTSVEMALGHEGVGIVRQVGRAVLPNQCKVGDRVGWGFLHSCCKNCKHCLSGEEIYCPSREMFTQANTDQGSFGSWAVWKADFLFVIPDGMTSSDAGPMMCAGATVFGALQQHGYKSTDRVGVVGIGGLGHLALQFCSKMGMEVAAFSHTSAKRDDAMAFGADEFYGIPEGKTAFEGVRPLEHLLVCSTVQPDWDLFLPIMAPRGTIYPLTAFEKDVVCPHLSLIFHGISIQGTMIATKQGYREMLHFAVRHGIKSVNQEFPMTLEGIDEAMRVLESGKMRYRGVLVA